MRLFFLLISFLPFLSVAQLIKIDDTDGPDDHKAEIEKNIYRVLLSAATDTKFSFAGSYEREILKPFTAIAKAGPAFYRQYDATDAFGDKQYQWFFNLIATAELRYYFNLNRRIRHRKTVRNFSAGYIGLETVLKSKPLFILNKSGKENIPGGNATFINLGYQHQYKRSYLNVFAGARFPGKVYQHTVSGIDLFHAGITIGGVF